MKVRCLFLLLLPALSASAETYKIDAGHSQIAFTIHGVTRPMTLHVKLATPASGGSLPASTRWTVTTDPINRKDFALTFGNATESISGISNNITPIIEIEAVQK